MIGAVRTRDSVYGLQLLQGGPIKVGWCRNDQRALNERLKAARFGNAFELVVRGVIAARPSGPKAEAELHARFDEYRLNGEWFWPVPELAAIFGALPIDESEPLKVELDRAAAAGYRRGFQEGKFAAAMAVRAALASCDPGESKDA